MGITRRGSRWLGYVTIVVTLGLFALIGFSTLDALVSTGLLLLTGLLFVLAGFETVVTERFGWHRVFGLGFFVVGIYQLTNVLFSGTDGVFYAITTVLLAGLFAFMGFDIARGGHHFDIDPSETV